MVVYDTEDSPSGPIAASIDRPANPSLALTPLRRMRKARLPPNAERLLDSRVVTKSSLAPVL